MDEIARFLHAHPPFDAIPLEVLLEAARSSQIAYFPADHPILAQGGDPSQFLYIVCRGSVDLTRSAAGEDRVIDTLGPGEAFGHPSLIRGAAPIVTARTNTEVLAYLIPAATFHRLRERYPAFSQFFSASAIERLAFASESRNAEADPALFRTRLADLVQRELITISPEAPVSEAARLMRDRNVSCLVVGGEPIGILTDRDLRNRVLAAGLPDSTAVRAVMTSPALAMPGDSLVFEGLMLMLERGIHHLPVTAEERVIGLVTHTDILRQQQRSPLFLPRVLQRAADLAGLRAYADQVAHTVEALIEAGARVSDIGRVTAVAHDALLVRLLRDAEAALGPAPCAYAWLVLGSEGRFEQTLRTDQDNALVYADEHGPEAEAYFARLAELVVEGLVACGFPRCPGEIMAVNPEWRQPLSVWESYFRRWINVPDEESLLRTAIFFDFRQVHGGLAAEAALRAIVAHAPESRVFLGRLARTTLRSGAPLGFFRQVQLERKGDRRDLLDLKLRGTALVVDLARLFALEAGVAASGTIARLRGAAGRSSLDAEGADQLVAAFEILNRVRLHHQQRQLARGEAPTNTVAFHSLASRDQREVKEALQAIAAVQRSVAFAFQTDRMA